MVEELIIFKHMTRVIDMIVDIVLRNGVSLDITQRQLHTDRFDEGVLCASRRTICAVIGQSFDSCRAGQRYEFSRLTLKHLLHCGSRNIHKRIDQPVENNPPIRI